MKNQWFPGQVRSGVSPEGQHLFCLRWIPVTSIRRPPNLGTGFVDSGRKPDTLRGHRRSRSSAMAQFQYFMALDEDNHPW